MKRRMGKRGKVARTDFTWPPRDEQHDHPGGAGDESGSRRPTRSNLLKSLLPQRTVPSKLCGKVQLARAQDLFEAQRVIDEKRGKCLAKSKPGCRVCFANSDMLAEDVKQGFTVCTVCGAVAGLVFRDNRSLVSGTSDVKHREKRFSGVPPPPSLSTQLLNAGLREKAIKGGQTTLNYKSKLLGRARLELDRRCDDDAIRDEAIEYFKSYSSKLDKVFNYEQVLEACAYLAEREMRVRALLPGIFTKAPLFFPCKHCGAEFACRKDLRLHRCCAAVPRNKVCNYPRRSESPCSVATLNSSSCSSACSTKEAVAGVDTLGTASVDAILDRRKLVDPQLRLESSPVSKRKRPGFRKLSCKKIRKAQL